MTSRNTLKVLSPTPLPTTNPERKLVDLQMAKMQQRAPSKRQIKMKRRFSLDEEERRIEAEKMQQQQQQQSKKDVRVDSEPEGDEKNELSESPGKTLPKKAKATKTATPSPMKRSLPSAPLVCRKCEKRTGPKTSFVACSDCSESFHQTCVIDEEDDKDTDGWKTTKKTPPKRRTLKFFRGWKCHSCRGKMISTKDAGQVSPAVESKREHPFDSKVRDGEFHGPPQDNPRRPSLTGEDGEKTNPFATESFDEVRASGRQDCDVGPSKKLKENVDSLLTKSGKRESELLEASLESLPVCEGKEITNASSSAQPSSRQSSDSTASVTQIALETETSSPRYDCDRCSKSFTNKAHLNRHVQSVHLKIQHRCDHCEKNFTRKDRLTEHLKQAHTLPASPGHLLADADGQSPDASSPNPISPMQKEATAESRSMESLDILLAANVHDSGVPIKS